MPVTKDEYYHLLAMKMIKNDCETLKALVPTLNQPYILLSSMPYLSLFCKSFEDYCHSQGKNIAISNASRYSIETVRSKLKLFGKRFDIATLSTEKIDRILDDLYLHHNLGIIYDSKSHIITNTQYLLFLFQPKEMEKCDLSNVDIGLLGKAIGTVINSVSKGLSKYSIPGIPLIANKRYTLFYYDIITDMQPLCNKECGLSKAISLLILHILCSVNYCLYIINDIVKDANPWKLRVQYISLYYAFMQLDRISQNLPSGAVRDTLVTIRAEVEPIINPDFRSCLMHYGFINKAQYLIDDNYLNYAIPFFGLVESCFGGKEYCDLLGRVNQGLVSMSNALTQFMGIEPKNLLII
ncbi:MAG: hypothetical protein VB055_03730 [Oscillospiraceae bacterium]|nr:hypothetical protein [Oscillospiraceae bacterium]